MFIDRVTEKQIRSLLKKDQHSNRAEDEKDDLVKQTRMKKNRFGGSVNGKETIDVRSNQ